jgi:hypothetical protein
MARQPVLKPKKQASRKKAEVDRPLTTDDLSRLYLIAVLREKGAISDAQELASGAAPGVARDAASYLLKQTAVPAKGIVRDIVMDLRRSARAASLSHR